MDEELSPGSEAGDAAATREQLIDQLRSECRQLQQETERQEWLAHELHDGLLQDVLAARMHLHGISGGSEGESPQQLEMVVEMLERAILEARQLVGDLRTIQQTTSLATALESLAADFRSGLLPGKPTEVDCQLEEIELNDPATMATVLRVARECLLNAARHSGVQRIGLLLKREPGLLLMEIIDEGTGFDPTDLPANRFGLIGMQQRIAALAGTLEIESTPGSGTRIRVRVPVS